MCTLRVSCKISAIQHIWVHIERTCAMQAHEDVRAAVEGHLTGHAVRDARVVRVVHHHLLQQATRQCQHNNTQCRKQRGNEYPVS
jgi:hypothetical protein